MKKLLLIYLLIVPHILVSVCYRLTIPHYDNGFFSIFFSVLGALDEFDAKKNNCTGVSVEFGNHGLYYDKDYGLNWWDYYFEPIHIGDQEDKRTIDLNTFSQFSLNAAYLTSCERGYELIKKYIKLKPHIEQKVDHYLNELFKNDEIIGVHYRGTDKILEATLLSYDTVINLVREEVEKKPHVKIYVATDEEKFLQAMHKNFPGKILSIDALRSSNGRAVHYRSQHSNYKKGEDALIDCILLSQCSKLYRTTSNLSAATIRFNPWLEVVLMSKNHHEVNCKLEK